MKYTKKEWMQILVPMIQSLGNGEATVLAEAIYELIEQDREVKKDIYE